MKPFFLIHSFIVAFAGSAFSQVGCSIANLNPSVTQPTGASVVSSTCSALSVKWQGTAGQTYCISATYFNPTTNQTETAVGTNIVCDGNQNCTAIIPVIAGVQITWSVQALSNGNASNPVISVLEYPIPACGGTGSSITFCGKVLLQGAYNMTAKKMNSTLNTLGILQAQASNHPYNNPPFHHTGTESVSDDFFAAHSDIVDWVLVELRDANSPSSLVASRAAFVKQDGTLVETDGSNNHVYFSGIATGKYHVAVRHRNHLGIRTATPLDFSCGNVCYDFTTGGYKGFKNQEYTSPVQVGTVWAMRAGNANANLNAKYNGPDNDQNQILNIALGGSLSLIISNAYATEDLNMDGKIKWNGPGNDQNILLNIVLSGLLSAVLMEQL